MFPLNQPRSIYALQRNQEPQVHQDNQGWKEVMMNVAEIKSKYAVDGVGMTVTVDIESLRTYAKEALREAERMVENQANEAKRIKLNGTMPNIAAEPDWNRRWKKRQQENIAEQRRSVEMANRLLSEITGILDKAEAKLKEVK